VIGSPWTALHDAELQSKLHPRIYLHAREERERQLAATLDKMARRELKASGVACHSHGTTQRGFLPRASWQHRGPIAPGKRHSGAERNARRSDAAGTQESQPVVAGN
jgi:hypothetical protein